jgi:hypothetical protein
MTIEILTHAMQRIMERLNVADPEAILIEIKGRIERRQYVLAGTVTNPYRQLMRVRTSAGVAYPLVAHDGEVVTVFPVGYIARVREGTFRLSESGPVAVPLIAYKAYRRAHHSAA